MNAGMLLIIAGPSGVGKTTITHHVEKLLNAQFSVSATTRPKTDTDVEGRDYYFVDRARFEQMRERGELLEWAEVFGNYYGTPRQPVQEAIAQGRLVILEIDVQGAVQVKKLAPQALGIFVLPPSEKVLLKRLRARRREPEEVIQRRFAKAKHEIAQARQCGAFDVFLVNDQLEDAVAQAVQIVREHQAQRQAESASG